MLYVLLYVCQSIFNQTLNLLYVSRVTVLNRLWVVNHLFNFENFYHFWLLVSRDIEALDKIGHETSLLRTQTSFDSRRSTAFKAWKEAVAIEAAVHNLHANAVNSISQFGNWILDIFSIFLWYHNARIQWGLSLSKHRYKTTVVFNSAQLRYGSTDFGLLRNNIFLFMFLPESCELTWMNSLRMWHPKK